MSLSPPPVGAFHPWLQIKLSDCQHFPELLRTKSTSKQKIKFPVESWRGCKINTMIEAFGCRCHNVLIIVGGVCTAACLQVFFSLSVCLACFGWRRIIFAMFWQPGPANIPVSILFSIKERLESKIQTSQLIMKWNSSEPPLKQFILIRFH